MEKSKIEALARKAMADLKSAGAGLALVIVGDEKAYGTFGTIDGCPLDTAAAVMALTVARIVEKLGPEQLQAFQEVFMSTLEAEVGVGPDEPNEEEELRHMPVYSQAIN